MLNAIECLEPRRLLSATWFHNTENGKFFVNGGVGADEISVFVSSLSIDPTGSARLTISDAGAEVFNQLVSNVKAVYVYPKEGDDVIEVSSNRTRVNVLISTRDGQDTVDTTTFLSPAPAIYTGDGNDTITSTLAAATLGLYVNAGADNDDIQSTYSMFYGGQGAVIVGGLGDDQIELATDPFENTGAVAFNSAYGQAGNDTIIGSELDDYLSGDDGNDRITGGNGVDFLRGGAGNDELLAADGTIDRIERGGGVDSVEADEDLDQVI